MLSSERRGDEDFDEDSDDSEFLESESSATNHTELDQDIISVSERLARC